MSATSLRKLPSASVARRRLLIVEGGAAAFSPDGSDGFDETVAMLALEGDEPADFAERVLRRLATREQSGKSFDAVQLFVGSSAEANVQAARRRVVLGIAAHAETSPHLTELVIVASVSTPQALRYQLLELADELVLSSQQKPLPVRLRFGDTTRAPVSGVFERVTER